MCYGTKTTRHNFNAIKEEAMVQQVVFKRGKFGSTMELYGERDCKGGVFRRRQCDESFDIPRRFMSYKILWD